MKKFNVYQASTIDELAWPEENQNLSLASSALLFITDFTQNTPLVVESSIPAIKIRSLMTRNHVRLAFVVDKDNHFLGVVSQEDLIDRKIVQKVSEGFSREELPITEFIIAKRDLKTLAFKEVEQAVIDDVLSMMRVNGDQYCLVADEGKIRGVFSANEISRKLHTPIYIEDSASFYKVFSRVG